MTGTNSRVTVGVLAARSDEGFAFEVEGRQALDAFNHPSADAARVGRADLGARIDGLSTRDDSGSDSQEPTSNPWRINHARTYR